MSKKVCVAKKFYILVEILLLAIVLGGCGDFSEEVPAQVNTANPLTDTRWRLVEFQSMDDTVGTIRPADPDQYTLQLNRDHSVNMQLNCNSATGTWLAKASADQMSGQFEFGPLAMTRAFCPLPSMDGQIASQAGYVRSYLLKEGRLYLSLMADGGIYVWEMDEDMPFSTEPNKKLEAAILKALPSYNREMIQDMGMARYVYGRVDLNADGKEEVFVYLLGPNFCGTGGCNLMLFTEQADDYRLVNDFPISRLPVIVLKQKTYGWSDIIRLESGGGAPATYVKYAFDGQRYVKKERNSAENIPQGKRYLSGELTADTGIFLEPHN